MNVALLSNYTELLAPTSIYHLNVSINYLQKKKNETIPTKLGPWVQYLDAFCHIGEPLSIFTSNRLYLSEMLFYTQSCYWSVTNKPKKFSNVLAFVFELLFLIKNFHEMVKYQSFRIWYVLYVLLGIKYGFMEFANHCIALHFTQHPNGFSKKGSKCFK